VTRVESFCKKRDSTRVTIFLNVTRVESESLESFCKKRDSTRVTIFLNVTRVESESPKIVTRVESLTRITLSLILFSRPHLPFGVVVHSLRSASQFVIDYALSKISWHVPEVIHYNCNLKTISFFG